MSHSAGNTPAADPYSWKSQLKSGGQRSDIPAEYQKHMPPGYEYAAKPKDDPKFLTKQQRLADEPKSERYLRHTRNAVVTIAVIVCLFALGSAIGGIAVLVHANAVQQSACQQAGTC